MSKPYYKQVEYIESTGNQWIDVGLYFKTQDNPIIKTKFDISTIQNAGCIFGGNYPEENNGSWFLCNLNDKIYAFSGGNHKSWTSGTTISDTKEGIYEVTLSKGIAICNGTTYTNTYFDSLDTGLNFALFAYRGDGTNYSKCSGCRIYYIQISLDGVLVRDMIPVIDYRKKPAMYDKVSKQLFYDEVGVEDFVVGSIISESTYINLKSVCEWEYGRGVLQDFRLKNTHFAENPDFYSNPELSGHATPGEFFNINDTLKEHLKSLKDVSFTINFNVHNNSSSTSLQGGLFTFTTDQYIGDVYGVKLAQTNINDRINFTKLYNRDNTIVKYMSFMQPYDTYTIKNMLYCSAINNAAVQKWDTNMSLTFTFKGDKVRLYSNGVLVNMPDTRGVGYKTYLRHSIDVVDKIQIPYNTSYNGNTASYIKDSDFFGEMYSLTFFGHALNEHEIKERMLFDEKRFKIKFGES